ncbi:MAG TPA: DUF305 domain-containing protein [Gemmatimonadales bacterium]|nr:DUF305 domain-containing protein [Gemmatimonadales bacterium]
MPRSGSLLFLLPAAFACAAATQQSPAAEPDSPRHHDHAGMTAEVVIPPGSIWTAADVHFMQGMIAHHAQAIHMTRLAEGSGASAQVLRIARKIDQSQITEIVLMQNWLADRGQFVADTSSWRTMSMPGMLTATELGQLASARGAGFDRLFLELMIRHHEGALQMVADLHATPRAAQEVDVSVFATEVQLVQTAEIDAMRLMLADTPGVK